MRLVFYIFIFAQFSNFLSVFAEKIKNDSSKFNSIKWEKIRENEVKPFKKIIWKSYLEDESYFKNKDLEQNSEKNTEENKGRLKKYKSSKTSDNTPSKVSTNSGFKRAKKDKVIFGICKGLENSGRGSANLWRGILVAVSLFLTGIPVILYIIAGLVIPISDE